MSWKDFWNALRPWLRIGAQVGVGIAEDKLRQKAGVPRSNLVELKAEADKRRRPVRPTDAQ